MARRRCMWLWWQEVMLVGITAPMYAVHAHARSWHLLDSLALLLSIAGALQSSHYRCYAHVMHPLETCCLHTHQAPVSLPH